MKVILGSAGDIQEGWVNTDIDTLDIRSREDFAGFFGDQKAEVFLLEHVIEHVEPNNLQVVFSNLYHFLQTGGYVRIAVPDGYHPDPEYIAYVSPPNMGHKALYNCATLATLLMEAGFYIELLEYWDENGNFHPETFHFSDPIGLTISRSFANDERNADGLPHYTSLIIDAWKER